MNAIEQGEVMKILQENYYYFDMAYNRKTTVTEQDKLAILSWWDDTRVKLQYWQIGKILNIENGIVYYILCSNGIDPDERATTLSDTYIELTCPYLPFDGGDVLRLATENLSCNLTAGICEHFTGLSSGVYHDIASGRRIPTRGELYVLSEKLNINLDIWKAESIDVKTIIDVDNVNKIPLTRPHNASDLGPLSYKKVFVRYNTAWARIKRGYSTKDVCNALHISDTAYERFEQGISNITVQDANKLALLLGISNTADVYTIKIMPLNYEYLLRKFIMEDARLQEMSYNLKNILGEEYDTFRKGINRITSDQATAANRYANRLQERSTL